MKSYTDIEQSKKLAEILPIGNVVTTTRERNSLFEEKTDSAIMHFELENCSFGDIIKPYKGYKAEISDNGQILTN